jgi:nucleoside-diphosphate-sugar epimerase
VARALIVGCGCRGRALGRRLLEEGWAVRGTSRSPEGVAMIEAAGIEGVLADPGLPATVLDLVGDVAVLFWLLGSARGSADDIQDLHGEKLEHLLRRLVDTPIRGFAYEASGSVPDADLRRGAAVVAEAGATWSIPTALIEAEPTRYEAWAQAAAGAALDLLRGGAGAY